MLEGAPSRNVGGAQTTLAPVLNGDIGLHKKERVDCIEGV